MKIQYNINRLNDLIDELIELEECETFDEDELDRWINLLKEGNFSCPCQFLGHDIIECRYYEYLYCDECNVCEDCDEEEDCEFDHNPRECGYYCECEGYEQCDECPRSRLWIDIQEVVNKRLTHNLPFSKLLVGNIIAKRLEDLD